MLIKSLCLIRPASLGVASVDCFLPCAWALLSCSFICLIFHQKLNFFFSLSFYLFILIWRKDTEAGVVRCRQPLEFMAPVKGKAGGKSKTEHFM